MSWFKRLAAIAVGALLAVSLLAGSTLAVRSDGDDVIAWSAAQLDAYWRTFFALQGQAYKSPAIVIVPAGETAQTACGEASGASLAFYCTPDQRIVISRELIDALAAEDEALPAFILAHEWSHHIDGISGNDTFIEPTAGEWNQAYVVESELRADCMAGAWFASLDNRDLLDATDASAVLAFAYEIGSGETEIDLYGHGMTHGTGEERIRAVLTGFDRGLVGCMAITPLERDGGDAIFGQSPYAKARS